MELLINKIDQIKEICEQHKVKQLYAFGSIVADNFKESSDIDFLIQFGEVELLDYFDNYMDVKEKLESILGKPVDLVENQAIRNPIFRGIVDRDKKLIYERKTA